MRGLDLADMLAYYRGLYWPADPAASGAFPIQIVIGDQTLHAVGAGVGFALQRQPRVAVAAIGDGATSEGDFLEALNFAGVFKAQTVVFIQNNQWAISLPRARQSASQTLAQKALAFGIPGVLVDGNDALAVYASTQWALEHARSGRGPVLIEALTYRIGAHTTADDPRRYQPPEEIAAWRARDPLLRLLRYLQNKALWSADDDATAAQDALRVIDAAMHESETREQPSLQTYFQCSHG
jgi:pyruvate dehydrogenase E1 component alpha subunit